MPGRIGTNTRTSGSRQLSYNGHTLYTYIGDSGPGRQDCVERLGELPGPVADQEPEVRGAITQ